MVAGSYSTCGCRQVSSSVIWAALSAPAVEQALADHLRGELQAGRGREGDLVFTTRGAAAATAQRRCRGRARGESGRARQGDAEGPTCVLLLGRRTRWARPRRGRRDHVRRTMSRWLCAFQAGG